MSCSSLSEEAGFSFDGHSSPWRGPVAVEDLAPKCCAAYGVGQRLDRPCLLIRNVLHADECRAITDAAVRRHDDGPRSLDPGERSEFAADDSAMSAELWKRIAEHVPAVVDGGLCVGLRTQWHHARYFPGQSVFAHMDQRQTCDEHRSDPAVASRMSMTVYLDAGFSGGELAFVTGVRLDGSHAAEHLTLPPTAGDAVLFYQAVPEFSHCAHAPRGGCKTIARSDVMYRFDTAADADVGGLAVDGGAPLV